MASFGEIADRTGENILSESLESRRNIQILWSGGIDSTVAIIALLKAASSTTLRSRIEVVCSAHSLQEYQHFFVQHIAGKLSCTITTGPIGEALDDSKLIVTGEHGDQLFGSVKLQPLVVEGIACRPYSSVFSEIAKDRGDLIASKIVKYLRPQVDAAPVPIRTVFDYIWWVNFSMKWQHVSLRLAVFRGYRSWPTYLALRHFFRTKSFQRWALISSNLRQLTDWSAYKMPAKAYILEFTGDQDYFQTKTKEPSLQNVLVDRDVRGDRRVRVSWRTGEQPRFRYFRQRKGLERRTHGSE